MRKKHLLFGATALCFLQIFLLKFCDAQTTAIRPIARQITNLKNTEVYFKPIDLFSINANGAYEMQTTIKGAASLILDLNALGAIREANDDAIAFSFPYNDKTITLELYRVNIFAADFTVLTNQSNGEAVPYNPGIYYRGIVKGDENSIASLSFFDGEMMGIVSTNEYMNINIGKSKKEGAQNFDYIIYSDTNLPNVNLGCATADNQAYTEQMKEYAVNGATLRTENSVKVYYEVDNNIYLSSGSTIAGATNWMTAVHNNIATLYSNDQITITLSQVFVWTTADPYTGTSSIDQLAKFKLNRPVFNGDIGLLVGVDPGSLGGVASTVNGLCSSSNKYCYADVLYSYAAAPAYSTTVMVCTHELGHLMGSAHSQSCSWPGGAIDNCYATEGGCPKGPAPVGGGTIMSYCHLTSYGINFNKGFGPLPSAAIQGAIDGAECLTPATSDTCITTTGLSASSVTFATATTNWTSASGVNSYNIRYRETGTTTWTSTTSATNSTAVSGLTASTQYEFEVQSVCTSGVGAYSSLANFTTASAPCADSYEPNNFKTNSATIPVNSTVNGLINSSTDNDWFNFNNTTSQKNIKVTLTGLPADYDIQLFDQNGLKIASSQNSNTENEAIIRNNSTAGNYKVKVFSPNAVFHAAQCYTLMVAISSVPFRLPEEAKAAVTHANIFPNPTNGDLTVTYNSSSDTQVAFYVADLTGKVMIIQSSEASKGFNTYYLDLNSLNRGIYFLHIKNGNEITNNRFVIGK